MIPTAKKFLIDAMDWLEEDRDSLIFETCIEFAKLHVQEALKQASEKVKQIDRWGNNDWESENPEGYIYQEVDKDSIIKAYPLENVK